MVLLKNNWNYILGFKDENENLPFILDYLFNDFVFKGYDENNNIIVISKKDFKEYRVIRDNKKGTLCFNYKINYNLDDCCEKLFCTLEFLRSNFNQETGLYNSLIVNLIIKKITSYNDNPYFEILKQKLCYTIDNANQNDKDLNNNTIRCERASITTQKHFLNSALRSNMIIPDLICETNMLKNQSEVHALNKSFNGKIEICDNPFSYNSNLPICYLAGKEHNLFLKNFKDEDEKVKSYCKKTQKIGF